LLDVWVIFYNPIGVNAQLPKQLQPTHIEALGRQLALFHRACSSLTNILPDWSKTLRRDMRDLAMWLEQPDGPIRLPEQYWRYPRANGVV
tara:strand:- start:183 stop:452 length:270 start_codon:yes stop_codon:yes gene_type:complete